MPYHEKLDQNFIGAEVFVPADRSKEPLNLGASFVH